MEDSGMGQGLVVGFLAGAVFGVIAGILHAPRSGAETREMLREKAMVAREKADELFERVKERAQGTRDCNEAV
jgi:gas vesicle protein